MRSCCRHGLALGWLLLLLLDMPAFACDAAANPRGGEAPAARVAAILSVAQAGTASRPVIYDILLFNRGSGDRPDDPVSDELVDVLPAELALRRVDADAGTITVDLAGNRVRWNGALASGAAAVAIRIEADVVATPPATIRNQACAAYDSNGDGRNGRTVLSTDPSHPGAAVPTTFRFAGAQARRPRYRRHPASSSPP
ncbi:hypothetical protein [Tahibacter harae]|uniref:Repeat protein (TIGR01451 family) n=1 Tax=Tahibacter harae TaxID=2963937 RepID=A0ABT1QNU3_9GAMM|nr:hypothetical protein [Tahibacter harae]MCQ4163277.1 hypothetical protein [Tahibacter harae]